MSSPRKDYYKILGIPKTASDEDIRRAYKRLALKWHPDKNQNNREEAEQKFKEIAEAYAMLTDKQKRARYDSGDNYDFDMEGMNDTFSFTDASKIFEKFFGGKDPFAAFHDDMFNDDFFGKDEKFGGKKGFGDFFGGGFGDDEFMKFGKGGFTENFSSSNFGSSGMGHSVSTKTSTVIKNGKKVTKTEKTTIGPDGKKNVEIIEEVKDRDGHVTRTVQSLEDGKEVSGGHKAISSEEAKAKYGKIPHETKTSYQSKMGPRVRMAKQTKYS